MNQPLNHSIAFNGVTRNPVNELLTGIMRSFGEEPCPRREPTNSQETKAERSQPTRRDGPKSKIP